VRCSPPNNLGQLQCQATYTPTSVGTQTLTAAYSGDALHSSSNGTFTLYVTSSSEDLGEIATLLHSGSSGVRPSSVHLAEFAMGTLVPGSCSPTSRNSESQVKHSTVVFLPLPWATHQLSIILRNMPSCPYLVGLRAIPLLTTD
jgi:hypothetical protein